MMLARQGLGLIPSYQFSMDPAVNFTKINPHVVFPPGMDQRTVQPVGKFYASPQAADLGRLPTFRVARADCCSDCNCGGSNPCCLPRGVVHGGSGGVQTLHGIFDSWAWTNRKWLVLGGLGLVAVAALAGAGAILR
jgi:hypothetical protein